MLPCCSGYRVTFLPPEQFSSMWGLKVWGESLQPWHRSSSFTKTAGATASEPFPPQALSSMKAQQVLLTVGSSVPCWVPGADYVLGEYWSEAEGQPALFLKAE